MSDLVDRLIAQKKFAWQSPLLDEIRAKLERLEKCEASIRELLCWFGPGSAASLGAKCETLQEALDAARAALEGGN